MYNKNGVHQLRFQRQYRWLNERRAVPGVELPEVCRYSLGGTQSSGIICSTKHSCAPIFEDLPGVVARRLLRSAPEQSGRTDGHDFDASRGAPLCTRQELLCDANVLNTNILLASVVLARTGGVGVRLGRHESRAPRGRGQVTKRCHVG